MAKGSNSTRARRLALQQAKQAEARMARERQAEPQEGTEGVGAAEGAEVEVEVIIAIEAGPKEVGEHAVADAADEVDNHQGQPDGEREGGQAGDLLPPTTTTTTTTTTIEEDDDDEQLPGGQIGASTASSRRLSMGPLPTVAEEEEEKEGDDHHHHEEARAVVLQAAADEEEARARAETAVGEAIYPLLSADWGDEVAAKLAGHLLDGLGLPELQALAKDQASLRVRGRAAAEELLYYDTAKVSEHAGFVATMLLDELSDAALRQWLQAPTDLVSYVRVAEAVHLGVVPGTDQPAKDPQLLLQEAEEQALPSWSSSWWEGVWSCVKRCVQCVLSKAGLFLEDALALVTGWASYW